MPSCQSKYNLEFEIPYCVSSVRYASTGVLKGSVGEGPLEMSRLSLQPVLRISVEYKTFRHFRQKQH